MYRITSYNVCYTKLLREYGEHPVTRIDVVVSSIKFCEKGSKGKDCVLVEVRGKVDKGFYYSEEEYRKLVKKVKLKVGSRGILMIFSGGPCPPMYQLQFPD